jgi:hypothetical protein
VHSRVAGALVTLAVLSASALHAEEDETKRLRLRPFPVEDTGGQAPHVKPTKPKSDEVSSPAAQPASPPQEKRPQSGGRARGSAPPSQK